VLSALAAKCKSRSPVFKLSIAYKKKVSKLTAVSSQGSNSGTCTQFVGKKTYLLSLWWAPPRVWVDSKHELTPKPQGRIHKDRTIVCGFFFSVRGLIEFFFF
jgi:hypothetical protein